MAVMADNVKADALVDRLPAEPASALQRGLHALVDGLESWRAEYLLQGLRDGDPTLVKLALTPYDDEPVTPEEEAAVAEARRRARLSGSALGCGARPLPEAVSPYTLSIAPGRGKTWTGYPPTYRTASAALERWATTGQGDLQPLVGTDEHSLRVGDWRIRMALDPATRTATVLRVLPRGSAYQP